MTTEFKFTYECVLPNTRRLKEEASGPAIWQMLTQEEWAGLPWVTTEFLLPIGTEFTPDILDVLNIQVNMINEWSINHHQPYRNVQFWSRELPLPNTEWTVTTLPNALHVPSVPSVPIVVVGFNKLTVSTTIPNDGGSPITDYIWQVSVPPYDVWTDFDDGGMLDNPEAILVGPAIVSGVTGKVRVAAINLVGISAFSEPSEEVTVLGPPATVPADPGVPTVIAGIDSITATIEAPNDGGSVITDYIWYVGTAPSYNDWTPFDSLSTELTAVLSLTGGTTGRVRVVAVNAIGSSQQGEFSEEVTALIAPTIPNVPIAPTVVAATSAIIASTTVPDDGGSPIIDYSWQYSIGDFTEWFDYTDDISDMPETILGGMTGGVIGKIRVAAINVIGQSEYSEPSEEVTVLSPATTPATPTAPIVVGGIEIVTASTTPPDDGGSPIIDYSWQYSVGDFTNWIEYIDGVSAIPEVVLLGMAGGVIGKVRVAAINAVGISEFSDPSEEVTVLSPPTVPSIPSIPIGTSSIETITAITTAPDDGGSPIIDYSWEYSVGDFTEWIPYADPVSDIPEITMTAIPAGTIGKVRVAAINAVGIGSFSEPSDSIEVPTPPVITAPEIPIAPTAIAGDPGAIVVDVVAPNDGGSPITDYVWQVSVPPYDVWNDFADGVSEIPSAILSGFGSGVIGKARVAAVNAIGQSSFSEPSQEVTTV